MSQTVRMTVASVIILFVNCAYAKANLTTKYMQRCGLGLIEAR